MSCPLPSDFQNLLVDVNAPVCDQLRKLGQLSSLVADAYECIYTQNGGFTQTFIDKLCASGCAGGSTDSSSTGAPGAGTVYRASQFLGAGSYRTVYKGRVFSMNPATWTYTTLMGDTYDVVIAMAFHPATGTIWALAFNQEAADIAAGGMTANIPLKLGTINPTSGAFNLVATVNTASVDWIESTTTLLNDPWGLVFKADGTLLFTHKDLIYTLDTSTAAVTALGSGYIVDSALSTSQEPTGFHRKTDGTLLCLTERGDLRTGVLDPTPYPPFSNAIVVTEDCLLSSPNPLVGPVFYGGAWYGAMSTTGDVYQITETDGTCKSPWTLKLVAPASMANVTCMVNSPT